MNKWPILIFTDLSEGVYLPQEISSCSRLCHKPDLTKPQSQDAVAKSSKSQDTIAKSLSPCCDAKAVCSCGTHTGHFACICPSGHYGRGLSGDCNRKLLNQTRLVKNIFKDCTVVSYSHFFAFCS